MIWYLDLAIVGLKVVGRIYQLAVEGSAAPGQIRQVGRWQAFGMSATWCDVNLGATHATAAEARQAVATWHAKEQAAAK